MFIQKDGKNYAVRESSKKWTVSTEIDKLTVSYDISKDICSTAEELCEYILEEDLF